MNVIDPLTITTTMLSACTAVDTVPATEWASGTYALDDMVKISGAAGTGIIDTYKCIVAHTGSFNPSLNAVKWLFTGRIYQVWNSVATYALGERVMGPILSPSDGNEHYVFESLIDGNINHAVTDTTKWLNVGANNKWAMFDLSRNSQTVVGVNWSSVREASADSTLTFTLTPGRRIDSLALLGMDANYVSIKVHSPGYAPECDAITGIPKGYWGNPKTIVVAGAAGTLYNGITTLNLCYDSGTINLKKREITTHYQYYFKGFDTIPTHTVFDIPPNLDNVITVTLTSTVGQVALGACCVGLHEYIGEIQYQAESDVLNFSTFTRDFAGGVSALVPRRNVTKTIQKIVVNKSKVNAIKILRDALAGRMAVWCGLDDNTDSDYYEMVLILGVYKRFPINMDSVNEAIISLEIEEY